MESELRETMSETKELNWNCEFGGNLLKINHGAPPDVLEYLNANGTRINAYDAWFVEGWDEYFHAPELTHWVTDLGPMRVPSLGGLSDDQLAQVVVEGFMGPKQPERVA